MTRRRAAILVCLCCCGVTFALGLWVFHDDAPALTWRNIRRVERGMTLAEVEGLLGPGRQNGYHLNDDPEWHPIPLYYWEAPDLHVEVWLDDEMRVRKIGRPRPPQSFFDKLRSWLRL